MSTIAAQKEKKYTIKKPRPISWATFEKKYLSKEDKYKYEWVKGYVEKTERTMNQYQIKIATILVKFFFKLEYEGKVSGTLMPETDTFFLPDVHRRPDIAYWTENQLGKMDEKGNQVPKFVIEVISKTDNINKVHEKMNNYWEAGVEVIWHIFPELKMVHVYKNKEMKMLVGEQICSASPVLPPFEISVNTIFGEK